MRLIDPLTTKITFDELTKKSYDLVGEMFGGFPGDTSAIKPGNNPLVLGKAYSISWLTQTSTFLVQPLERIVTVNSDSNS